VTAAPFDPKAAVAYGRFVQAAYTMYRSDPNNLTPPPSADFPAAHQLSAWITMQDFILNSTNPVFYGFIAHSISEHQSIGPCHSWHLEWDRVVG